MVMAIRAKVAADRLGLEGFELRGDSPPLAPSVIAAASRVYMLEHAIYSVISPEGCASILWRSADMAPEAAEALAITSSRLKTLGLIDKIVPEPLGGAHRDPQAAFQALKRALAEALKQVQEKKPKELVEARLERLMGYGKFNEAEGR